MRKRIAFIVVLALGVAPGLAAGDNAAHRATPMLHERITVDARDDIAMGVTLGGDIPAAIETRSGLFSAPDPNRLPTQNEIAASATALNQAMQGTVGDTFTPDRDTRRPNVLKYEDPFTPSTAPFKRLVAFDAVDARFGLYTYSQRLTALPIAHGTPNRGEDVFYADLPLDVGPDKHTRIPSVGPGSRVLHARLGVGSRELPVQLVHDGADNWFVDSSEHANARLVLELAIQRSTFGGELADPEWSALGATPVPEVVSGAAKEVLAHIGLSHAIRPAENIRKMVAYFRAFVDSDRPLEASKDVYTDLALSQKGVCRHRAYAFTITALALGIPSRMVMNEAHAWVEVFDGTMWRRIDLGGAGTMLSEESKTAEPYAAPADNFPWPPNASRGADMTEKANDINGNGNGNGNGSASPSATAATNTPDPQDKRAASRVAIAVTETDATRGSAVHVKGSVTADGEACGGVSVTVVLRDLKTLREARIGSVPTDAKGAFSAPIVLPSAVPLGDYDVLARTDGDARCGRGISQ